MDRTYIDFYRTPIKYKFVCTSAAGGEDKFYLNSYGDFYWSYYCSYTSLSSINKFTAKSNFESCLKDGKERTLYGIYNNPKMDRYY